MARFQSIEIGEVADRLVALAEGAPLRAMEEMGGPEILSLDAMADIYQAVRGRSRAYTPGADSAGRRWDGFRNAVLTPDHAVGVVTWEQYCQRVAAG